MVSVADVRQVDHGSLLRRDPETGEPYPGPVLGHLVRHPAGLLLFDTGIGAVDEDTEARYRPVRHRLERALGRHGVAVEDVTAVVNCHLHFDHCGGNPTFAGIPIVTQVTELAATTGTHYTIPELVDFRGAVYEQVDGEVELYPGIWLLPTPGHTRGHQSLVVRCDDGTVVLAGQAHETAAAYGADVARWHAGQRDDVPDWVERLLRFDPSRVCFAHDLASWQP